MTDVAYAEKAFLKLIARRMLGYAREAESRGEKYHDVGTFSTLQCGVRAKYRLESVPGGYAPVVILKRSAIFTPDELLKIAGQILDEDAVQRESTSDDLEYVRKSNSIVETHDD